MNEEAPLPTKISSNSKILSLNLELELNCEKYILEIKSKEESMIMILYQSEEKFIHYIRRFSLKQLKELNQFFSMINSCNDFVNHFKKLSEEKKIYLNKKMNNIDLCFVLEYFSQNKMIEITLYSDDIACSNLEERIKNLENENKELRKEIQELKKIIEPINKKYMESMNINKHTFNEDSVIMKCNDFELIYQAIKSRLNKEVKGLRKLYQATLDGDSPFQFHSKCDNIPNTLTLIKSAGNSRFGGFASNYWESPLNTLDKDDKNAFLFSLDKQKIYSYKNDGKALICDKNCGPCFGNGFTIGVIGNSIKGKKLYTRESDKKASYNFDGDKNALSESGRGILLYASEIEVFQIILEI